MSVARRAWGRLCHTYFLYVFWCGARALNFPQLGSSGLAWLELPQRVLCGWLVAWRDFCDSCFYDSHSYHSHCYDSHFYDSHFYNSRYTALAADMLAMIHPGLVYLFPIHP